MGSALFRITVRRDKKRGFLRPQEAVVLVDAEDGGFSLDIEHLGAGAHDATPVKLSGFIGADVISTTAEFKGSARLKRTTPRMRR